MIELTERESPRRCVYCHDSLRGEAWTCDACQATLHVDCQTILGRCPTIGCDRSRTSSTPRHPGAVRRRIAWLAVRSYALAWGIALAVVATIVVGLVRGERPADPAAAAFLAFVALGVLVAVIAHLRAVRARVRALVLLQQRAPWLGNVLVHLERDREQNVVRELATVTPVGADGPDELLVELGILGGSAPLRDGARFPARVRSDGSYVLFELPSDEVLVGRVSEGA